ncbi:MAG: hypothetical protein AAF215_12520 [Cyanobacteria bacterium P01_A01_bin.123]
MDIQIVDMKNKLLKALQERLLAFYSPCTQRYSNATGDVWDVLDSLTGSVEAPADWSVEHDHYLYGTPKRRKK